MWEGISQSVISSIDSVIQNHNKKMHHKSLPYLTLDGTFCTFWCLWFALRGLSAIQIVLHNIFLVWPWTHYKTSYNRLSQMSWAHFKKGRCYGVVQRKCTRFKRKTLKIVLVHKLINASITPIRVQIVVKMAILKNLQGISQRNWSIGHGNRDHATYSNRGHLERFI